MCPSRGITVGVGGPADVISLGGSSGGGDELPIDSTDAGPANG